MNIFGQKEDEDPLYHCKTWSFGVWEKNTFIFIIKKISIAKICYFDLCIILSLLYFIFEIGFK
jgi:hypothetical protein